MGWTCAELELSSNIGDSEAYHNYASGLNGRLGIRTLDYSCQRSCQVCRLGWKTLWQFIGKNDGMTCPLTSIILSTPMHEPGKNVNQVLVPSCTSRAMTWVSKAVCQHKLIDFDACSDLNRKPWRKFPKQGCLAYIRHHKRISKSLWEVQFTSYFVTDLEELLEVIGFDGHFLETLANTLNWQLLVVGKGSRLFRKTYS